jgi:hypothetical protein
MHAMASSRVTGTDPDGREHTVRVTGAGARRKLECGSCDWTRAAQFLPWLKAEEHLAEAHHAAPGTVGPGTGGGQDEGGGEDEGGEDGGPGRGPGGASGT